MILDIGLRTLYRLSKKSKAYILRNLFFNAAEEIVWLSNR